MSDSTSMTGKIHFAESEPNPFRLVLGRVGAALGLVFAISLIVFAGRAGYSDGLDGDVDLLDSFYYATVSVTTTGYGDIVPVTDTARLVTVLVVTPMRVAFLILVVSTTVEVLATSTRYLFRVQRWRRAMKDHYVICGYGTKGRSAAATLMSQGIDIDRIVVVERDAAIGNEATADGHTVVIGDCTRESVLARARTEAAAGVVVAVDRDDTAVLATLTVRALNANAKLVSAVKEGENSKLLQRSGASLVITSDEATGRLLGLALDKPYQAALIEDLLLAGSGVDLGEGEVTPEMTGKRAPEGTLGVIRDGRIHSPEMTLVAGDRLLFVEPNGDRVVES